MNDRERFLGCALGESIDRPPYWLYWAPWKTTWAGWEKEGKPAEMTDYRSAFNPDQPPFPVPVNCGPCPRLVRTVVEEDDDYIVSIDNWGVKRRDFKHRESMSEFLEFPVKNRNDWERFKAERLDPDHPDRLSGDWRNLTAEWTRKGYPIQLGCYPDVGLFGGLRWLLGDEECLMAFYTMPDLVHDIMTRLAFLYLAVFEKVADEARIDVIHLWEDICGRQGPLISPAHWEEFMGPNYQRIQAFAKANDIPVISVDTDGDPNLLIPSMLKTGVNFLFPMEVAAGCDVNQMKENYPTLAMMGGIDKRVLSVGSEAIDEELARIKPAMEKGRYIPDLDHLVPDDVSWENYCYYANALKKLVGKS